MVVLRYSFVLILFGVLLIKGIRAARKWDYNPISIAGVTSNSSLISFDLKIVRISRGEYGISGTVEWNYDTTDETMVEAIVYRSYSGSESDYSLLPFSIPKQTFYGYLNTYYKNVIMKNFGPCINVPQFEDKFIPPWPRRTYIIDKCVFSGDGLPEIVLPGFYKIVFKCFGPEQPSWAFVVVLKIWNKFF
ncbi:uncharacterized protein LOC108029870 [Drosophila biarmipes]|uniref:uncharacterized protein LOC108029870 n=1 Tax=Drosophila biarmipes TaxID=125945 RepID=UPI0007E608C1|nr:uncharacterized protein LOC108029870 [Drosophila biarmipes]